MRGYPRVLYPLWCLLPVFRFLPLHPLYQRLNTNTPYAMKLQDLAPEQLSALDEIVYRLNLIESANGRRSQRGFRVQGKFYFYFCDANQAARLIALRLANSATS